MGATGGLMVITRQRVAKAVQENVSGLGVFLAIIAIATLYTVARACVMWWNDYQQRQDPVSAAMLISTMVMVGGIIGGVVKLVQYRRR